MREGCLTARSNLEFFLLLQHGASKLSELNQQRKLVNPHSRGTTSQILAYQVFSDFGERGIKGEDGEVLQHWLAFDTSPMLRDTAYRVVRLEPSAPYPMIYSLWIVGETDGGE